MSTIPIKDETQKEVIDFIENSYDCDVILAGVTGSHMWGLQTEESDIDIRGIFVKPTQKILSIRSGSDTINAMDLLDKDIDIQFWEIEKVFNMLLSNNGNLIELMLAPTLFLEKEFDYHQLANTFQTKALAPYYEGYFHSQRKRAARNQGGKALIYTFREIMAGTVLMRKGELIHDFDRLREEYEEDFYASDMLVEWLPREKWNKNIDDETMEEFKQEWEGLKKIFKREVKASNLAEKHNAYDKLNEKLLDIRNRY